MTQVHAGEVWALLGVTNTGKTHRAIERMLEHDSGMLGVPLRLLAREVYERISERVGEQAVALVTGEEKRVPPAPRYWVATVEALPRDLAVDFVAVDEVQLMAHPERGHVFTDCVLHLRGRLQTWLLGAPTAERLLRQLVPGLQVTHCARFSRLSHLGRRSLRSLPRRSAVVSFRTEEVYRLAEVLRERKGGAAVVLGALSPRARNAQVALYESGEVDYLVATDAIGMGLNLDIDHVGLASLHKFDGFEHRPLEVSELAQIAGRAGRHVRDGSFGAVSPVPDLAPALVRALENHRLSPIRYAYYRSSSLDYGSVAALRASLSRRPPAGPLRRAPDADDVRALDALHERPDVMERVRDPAAVALLWQVCHIPNYEGRIPEHHALLLAQVFQQLSSRGVVGETWLERQFARLSSLDGGVDELTGRIAAARTWSYVAHQRGWVERPGALRERATQLEEQLSDALHARLRERFVRPRAVSGGAAAAAVAGARERRAQGPFAQLAHHALWSEPQDDAQHARERWVDALASAEHDAFELDEDGLVRFGAEPVARLVRGSELLRPALRAVLPDWLDGGMRRRAERRLWAYARDVPELFGAPLRARRDDPPALRGLLYQLLCGLGTVDARRARDQLALLEPAARLALSRRGVVCGRRTLFLEAGLQPGALVARRALCRVAGVLPERPPWPASAAAHRRPEGFDRELCLCLGYATVGSFVIRCDHAEALLAIKDPALRRQHAQERLGLDEGAQLESLLAALARSRPRRRRRRPRHS